MARPRRVLVLIVLSFWAVTSGLAQTTLRITVPASTASARKVKAVKRSFVIQSDIGQLSLLSNGAFTGSFFVGRDSDIIATISPKNIFSRTAITEVESDDLDFRLVVFVSWLVILMWRRQQTSG